MFLPATASWLNDLETELFSFPGGRYDDQIDSISQALAYEISFGELTSDTAMKGFVELSEAIRCQRYF